MPFSKSAFPGVFNPSLPEGNTYQAFNNYIKAWEMSYDVAWIGELIEDASELVPQQHKAKDFRMCVFQGERLKMDLKSEFNQDLAQFKQADFNTMVGCPRGVMVKAMHCGIVVREFVLQSRYYFHFRANTLGKGMNPLFSLQLWVNSRTD